MKRTVFAYPYVVWMLIFILAPMLMIAYYAFTSDGAFTLANLTGALTNEMYMQVLLSPSGILNNLLKAVGLPAQQFLYTESAVMLGTVYNFLPFMILPIYTVLSKMDQSQIEAAHDLGANGPTTFFKVVLPLSMPGVISGITMVFIPAITTFAISRLLGGGKFMLYGDLIENQFITLGVDAWGSGSALSFILLVLVLISMAVMRRAEREAGEEGGGKLW